ncbi:hypothetical protein [Pararhodobacter oceanensis]|uniref:DUF2125 domain-containing protein n=1 Tax=Pararhodobacter oceanensis TaxID=2172121 RepID=A0A2T8HUZ5_9RHOB|nr:hypothetical protein [Pararhodobacter oceanensis]PVH29280.1 hypothetical protein DDE20_09725 [Pararhodobacter oceanensis]
MMLIRLTQSILAAFCLVIAFSVAALAQESEAKTAWQNLRSTAASHGVVISSQGATDYGTSLVAQNVRVFLEDDPDDLLVHMPELRIEPRGTAIALVPSPEFTVTIRPSRRELRELTFTHDGEIVADVSDDQIAIDLLFDQLSARLTRSERRGEALSDSFEMSLEGFTSSLNALREGSADFTLGAETTRYDFSFDAGSARRPSPQSGDGTIAGLLVELSGRELDMLGDDEGMLRAAFDAGLAMRLVYSAQSVTGNSSQMIEGAQVDMTSSGGASEFVVDIRDGVFAAHTTAGAAQISGGMAGISGDVSFGGLGLHLGFPMLSSAEDQPLYLRFNLDDLIASEETLALAGAGDFAGEAVSLALEVSALGRLTEDMGPEFFEADEPPFDVTSVSLDRLLTRVGAAEFTGSGAFAFLGGLLASIDQEMPNGTGDFVFELIGGDALLTRLSALGVVPQDQQFFVRMMLNGLGRPVGEDHLRADVAIRPGGAVTVNGAPLPF